MNTKNFLILFLLLMKLNSSFSQVLFAKKISQMNQAVGMVLGQDSTYNIVSFASEFIRIDKFGATLAQPSNSNSCNPVSPVFSIISTIDSGFIISGYTIISNQVHRPSFAKANSIGEIQWCRYSNELNNLFGFSTIQLSDGSLISSNTVLDSLSGINLIYLQKTDSAGNLQWAETFRNQVNCYLSSFRPTHDNGFIISGQKGLFPFLAKFDSSGAILWSRSIPSFNSSGKSIFTLSDGNYIVLGQSGSYPNSKFFLAKVDTLGNLLWYNLYDRTLENNEYKVIERSNGDLVIAGCVDNRKYGFLMIADSVGVPKFTKKYVVDPAFPYTYFRDVVESKNLSLTLFGYGQIDSIYSTDIFIKVDSVGEGFCNIYPDTFQYNFQSYTTLIDSASISPFTASTTSVNCASSFSSAISSNLCLNNEVAILKDRKIFIYPNPVKDNLTISFIDNFTANSIEFYNSLGQKVLCKEINDSQDRELSISISLPLGIYYGRLISGQEALLFNFIVMQ